MEKMISKWIKISLIFMLSSCATKVINSKPVIPYNSCVPPKINYEFETTGDLSAALRNALKSSYYANLYEKRLNTTIICYDSIIKELTK